MGVMLHPVRWESHAYPASGGRPQAIINKQIVESGDILIGIFGSRLGTPTGAAQSGTIEEIEEFRKAGKYVALYFSTADVPRSADRAQLEALETYKRERQKDTLYFEFEDASALRDHLTRQLPRIVGDVRANLKNGEAAIRPDRPSSVAQPPVKQLPGVIRRLVTGVSIDDDLNPKEVELLWTAAKSSDGQIYHSRTLEGEGIRANQRHFLAGADARTASEWISALRGLENRGFVEALNDDRDFFKLTGEGYTAADQVEEFTRWDAHSITLRAYYMNADPQEQKVECQGIIALPATYYPDQVGVDGFVSRGLKERRTLLLEGVGASPDINWTPTDVEFVDDATGKVETLRVDGMEHIRPGGLKLPIVSA